MSKIASQFVQTALANTKENAPEIYYTLLAKKLSGQAVTCYEQFFSIEELEYALFFANWDEIAHPAMLAGYTVFRANLPANVSIVYIPNAPENSIFEANDPTGTKKVSLVISGEAYGIQDFINETYVVIDPNMFLCEIKPSEPIKKSNRQTSMLRHGEPVTKNTALHLGWEWARII